MSVVREKSKCPLACNYCRLKKARCNGARPCSNCSDRRETCAYADPPRRPRKRKAKDQDVQDRLARMEELLRAATTPGLAGAYHLEEMGATRTPAEGLRLGAAGCDTSVPMTTTPPEIPGNINLASEPAVSLESCFSPARFQQPVPTLSGELTPQGSRSHPDSLQPEVQLNGSNMMPQNMSQPETTPALHMSPATTTLIGDETINGSCMNRSSDDQPEADSTSCLRICSSSPAIKWVSNRIGHPDFLAAAKRLSTSVEQGERLGRTLESRRVPEPDRQLAFTWTGAYFDGALDAIFSVISKSSFEDRLRAHFDTDPNSQADASWYALRNIVYASGCRISLSDEAGPAAFAQSRLQSWGYYENALSVHTELIYASADLDAIRALLLMAFFTEALGSPGLEYMLLSNAVRLAQSRGLHSQQPRNSTLSQDEISSRQYLWWMLYAYDKHLAYRSGRPSAIDDDFVSCPLPTYVEGSRDVNLGFVIKTIQHAQISSDITRQLTSPKAMRDSPEEMLRKVRNIERRLVTWHQSLDAIYQARTSQKNVNLPRGTQVFHVLFMKFSYSVSMIAIHGMFCYPWDRPDIQNSRKAEILAQIEESTEIVAEAARQIILGVQKLEVTSALPVWLALYFPLVGLVNLFIYILKNPLVPTVASDLSLMDVVVGHFGYLEFASSSELVFPFAREITSYARELVKRAREMPDKVLPGHDARIWTGERIDWEQIPSLAEMPDLENTYPGMEDWRMFLPPLPHTPMQMMGDNLDPEASNFVMSN